MRRRAATAVPEGKLRVPVEERIRKAAARLIEELGVGVISMRNIAQYAETNEAVVYRCFPSLDHVILSHLQRLAEISRNDWADLHGNDGLSPQQKLQLQLSAVQRMAVEAQVERDEWARMAAEITARFPLSQRFVRQHWQVERGQLAKLCEQAGYRDPKNLADKLFMLMEGARVGAECVGPDGPGTQLVTAADTLIRSHTIGWPR
jgi:AcrR family transcriptional regulator